MIARTKVIELRTKGIDAENCSKGQGTMIMQALEKYNYDLTNEELKAAIVKYGAKIIEE